jgi:hypothetical protein
MEKAFIKTNFLFLVVQSFSSGIQKSMIAQRIGRKYEEFFLTIDLIGMILLLFIDKFSATIARFGRSKFIKNVSLGLVICT